MTDIALLNGASKDDFIDLLNGIYEHAPWVAELTHPHQPFKCIDDLHTKMQQSVLDSSHDLQQSLICNHPELAGKEAAQGSLTAASLLEQANSGLSHCSADELRQFKELNSTYRLKFGFPFVVAVKGFTRYDILELMQQRLKNRQQQEFESCLEQIGKIAKFRLMTLLESD